MIEAMRLRHRPASTVSTSAGDTAAGDTASDRPGMVSTLARLGRDLGRAGRYVRADPRLLSVIGLVGAHCSLTMAFDSMMPTLSEKVGGTSGLYSAILVGLGAGAITGTLSVSQLQRERVRGAVFAAVGIGSGFAMVVLGLASTPTLVVLGALLAGLTQASYMTMSAALIQEIVTDEYRGRVMSLYLMIAAGHMAILNLGYGRVAEVVDVRVLLVGPGLAWAAIFALSTVGLTEVRSLVRSGRFVSTAKSGIVAGA